MLATTRPKKSPLLRGCAQGSPMCLFGVGKEAAAAVVTAAAPEEMLAGPRQCLSNEIYNSLLAILW